MKAPDRNIRLYAYYVAAFQAMFWMPVFFLYFSKSLDINWVLRLEATYYLAVVALEVPSGYLSDRWGRRLALVVSGGALLAAHVLFFSGSTFLVYAAAQVLLAAGIAFNSGSDTSLHYDSLLALGREGEYAAREARLGRLGFASSAFAAVVGGAIALISLRIPYALSAAGGAIVLAVALRMRDVEAPTTTSDFVGQLKACATLTRKPLLSWCLAYVILMTALNHVPYEFYQPYLELVLDSHGQAWEALTPLVAGLHMAAAMVLGGWAAGRSVWLRDRLGLGGVLLAALLFQILMIIGMSAWLSPAVAVLLLLRSVPRGMMTAPLTAAIQPELKSEMRATYLSLQSLLGRLAFSLLLALLSIVPAGRMPHSTMAYKLALAAAVGGVGLALLARARSLLQERSSPPSRG